MAPKSPADEIMPASRLEMGKGDNRRRSGSAPVIDAMSTPMRELRIMADASSRILSASKEAADRAGPPDIQVEPDLLQAIILSRF
jgi:hypothetical protein